MDEEFKQIINFPNYMISNQGRIKNLKSNKFLKISLTKNGYYFVNLKADNNFVPITIHRLLGLYFIPNPENKRCIDHIDRKKINNSLINLRWVSHQENNLNKSIQKKNKSGYSGVEYFYRKHNKCWRASIQFMKVFTVIGYFETIELAIEARKQKETELFKDFKPIF